MLGLVWWETGLKWLAIGIFVLIVIAAMWNAWHLWKQREQDLKRKQDDASR